MDLHEFFKLNRPLNQSETQQLIAGAILALTEAEQQISPANLTSAEHCALQLGIISADRETFRKANFATFPVLANTFINRLIQVGVLEHDWVAGTNSHKLNPNRKPTLAMLTTHEGLEITEFVETLHDAGLRSRCESMLINTGSPDTLIREAVTVLEDRLRQSVEGKVDRRDLPAKVLHPDSGTKKNIFPDAALQLDFFHLVRGVLGHYGTPAHHGLQEIGQQTATRVVGMIDEILDTMSINDST
ncbi:MAG: hypothetical protein IH963_10050 [Chloroflexi bacterium]|nr:hypothetical protein [Chloroflexota bacterium]